MRIGFAKVDITPRVGVPLCGFGPFLNRISIGIRDRLWARAMAVEVGSRRVVVVACDLVGITREDTERARARVTQATGLPREAMMVSCSHTHSGPDTCPTRIGWGGYDPPYMELLSHRVARAAVAAIGALQEATLSHAEVPCEGIGLNRVYDKDAPPLAEVLEDDWRPAKPELTDTRCHVFAARAGGRLIGFASSFGCHPVCCCSETRYFHGDFVGVATNSLERENPGAVGLFLQGAEGDVNSCVVHKPEPEALLALDVIAARYARHVRVGLREAEPIEVDGLACTLKEVQFSHRPWTADDLRKKLAEEEAAIRAETATDSDRSYRMSVVRAIALRRLLAAMERGDSLTPPAQLQGLRIGPVSLLGGPFEIFQAIKNDVKKRVDSPIPLVLGLCNDTRGYAFDRTEGERGGYGADIVPMIHGYFPYARIHDELADGLVAVHDLLRA
jgi:hypothetical protein